MKKQFAIDLALIITIIFIPCFLLIYSAVQKAESGARRSTCIGHMRALGLSIECCDIFFENDHLRFIFGDGNGTQEYWSWRLFWIKYHESELFQQLYINEPWNSERNLRLIEKIQTRYPALFRHFYCPSDQGYRDGHLDVSRCPYVAVTGPGTVWTAMREGILLPRNTNFQDIQFRWEFSDMILFIETSEPKNHWAEPGDDVSPEEVMRLFEADPGLVKNTGRPFPSRYSHWPKHYVTFFGEVKRFDEFEDADALRKALVNPRLLSTRYPENSKLELPTEL